MASETSVVFHEQCRFLELKSHLHYWIWWSLMGKFLERVWSSPWLPLKRTGIYTCSCERTMGSSWNKQEIWRTAPLFEPWAPGSLYLSVWAAPGSPDSRLVLWAPGSRIQFLKSYVEIHKYIYTPFNWLESWSPSFLGSDELSVLQWGLKHESCEIIGNCSNSMYWALVRFVPSPRTGIGHWALCWSYIWE